MMSCTGRSRIRQETQQALGIVQQQVGPLISRKAAREAERQGVGIEQVLRTCRLFGRSAGGGETAGIGVRVRKSTRDWLRGNAKSATASASEIRRMSCSSVSVVSKPTVPCRSLLSKIIGGAESQLGT